MKNIITIEIPIYHVDVIINITDNFSTPNKKFKLGVKESEIENANAWTITKEPDNDKLEIYCLFRPNDLSYNTFLHEIYHVISFICEERGIDPDATNDEALAYLQGYIGGKILDFRAKYIEKERNLLTDRLIKL